MASISGIYEIVNKVNGHRYIGQSIDILKRWRVHKYELGRGTHHSRYLQNAWNKYGADGFEFNVISYCLPFRIVMDALEQHYIDTLHPEYNLSPTAGGSCAGVVRSQETKDKISAANKGRKLRPEQRERHLVAARSYKHLGFIGKHTQETKDKISAAMNDERKKKLSELHKGKVMTQEQRMKLSIAKKGAKMSDATKAKISAAMNGKNKGKQMSQETKNKLSLANKGRRMSDESKAKLSVANKGKIRPLEHIQKMKEGWAKKRSAR